jgi:hypothetical protein
MLGVVGCASAADDDPPLTVAAHTLGVEIAAARGGGDVIELRDIVQIARGGQPDGFRADVEGLIQAKYGDAIYLYGVTCRDHAGKRLAACGQWTASADAIVLRGGHLTGPYLGVFHSAVARWTVRALDTDRGWATSTSSSMDDATLTLAGQPERWSIAIEREATLVLDLRTSAVTAGSITASLTLHELGDPAASYALDAVATFSQPGAVHIDIGDEHAFWLDLASGELTAAVILR